MGNQVAPLYFQSSSAALLLQWINAAHLIRLHKTENSACCCTVNWKRVCKEVSRAWKKCLYIYVAVLCKESGVSIDYIMIKEEREEGVIEQ